MTAGTTYALVVGTDGADGPTRSGSASPQRRQRLRRRVCVVEHGPATWQGDPAIDRRFSTFVSFTNSPPTCGDVGPVATTKNTPVAVAVSCTDVDAFQTLTYYRAPTRPTAPSSRCRAAGRYIYTPAAGYTGPDSFTYQARDGYEISAVRTVTLTVGAAASLPPAPPRRSRSPASPTSTPRRAPPSSPSRSPAPGSSP